MPDKTKNTTKTHQHHELSRRYRWPITVVVVGLLCFVLVPQTDALWRSLDILSQAALAPVGIAMLMASMTYLLSSEIYHLLLKHAIRLRVMALVQVATALTSRVVPIGIGTMGFNALFLKHQNHSTAESLAVVATNNIIGLVGHLTLLAVIATTAPLPDDAIPSVSWSVVYWVLVIVALLVIVVAASSAIRRRVSRGLHSLWVAIYGYRHYRRRIVAAFGISMLLSTVYVLTLMASAQALGVYIPFNQIFIIYTFSLLTGAATPTPGGIVGVEAGLVGGFVAFGTATDVALAVALLYRLITYWLPLLPGFIAFRIVQHKYL